MARSEEAPRQARGTAIGDGPTRPAATEPRRPPGGLSSRARLGAALLGIAIALLAAAACGAVGLLLAQAFFGTTGSIL